MMLFPIKLLLCILLLNATDPANIQRTLDNLRQLQDGLAFGANDVNRDIRSRIITSLGMYLEDLEIHDHHYYGHQALLDRIRNVEVELVQLRRQANALDNEINNRGIDARIRELTNLQTRHRAEKQLEDEARYRCINVSSQMENNYKVLENNHRILVNDLGAIERDFNFNQSQLKSLTEALEKINAELHKYDIQASFRDENAKNALAIANLKNRNLMLRLEREAHEKEFQQAEELMERLQQEKDELEIQLQQLTLDSKQFQSERARYDAQQEKIQEYEEIGVLYESIKELEEKFRLTEELARTKDAELENLVKLSERLSEDLKRCQKQTKSPAKKLEDLPGSVVSLQDHASKKCKDLAESIQNIYHKKVKYNQALEKKAFLRNLVSAVLMFFSVVIAIYFVAPSILSFN